MKPPSACRWLENKAYFFPPLAEGARLDGDEARGTDIDPDGPASTPFWCNQTQDAVGPDGGFVCDESCTAKRACFAPDAEL